MEQAVSKPRERETRDVAGRQPVLVGYACGIGSAHKDSRRGPETFQRYLASQPASAAWPWHTLVTHDDVHRKLHSLDAMDTIAAMCEQLAAELDLVCARGQFPVIIGGDHSSGIGTWSGIARAMRPRGELGLLWFDAHMDSHTVHSTPSGYCHGMPIAALLGEGDQRFTSVSGAEPKLRPENICLIGVRDYEAEEKEFLESQGVRVFYMDDVAARGLPAVIDEALARVKDGTAGFGVSIDIDGFDPSLAPAVGTAVPDGIDCGEFLGCFEALCADPELVGVEVAEFNPSLDIEQRTLRVIGDIVTRIFASSGRASL